MNIFSPNTLFFDSYYDKARYLLAWRVSLVFIPIFIIITILYSFTSFNAATPSFLVILVGLFCLSFLYFTKNYKPIFWVYAISGCALSNYAMNTVFELTHYNDFLWILICIFLSFLGLGRKIGIMFIIGNAILIFYFFQFSLNKHISTIQPRNNVELYGEFLEVLFAFFILGYLTHQYFLFQQYSEKELKNLNTELETQNQLISAKNNENIVLMKEVHHRVKNNLQIITSLLRLQKNNLPPEAEQKFDEAIGRIMTMALIHSKLYQSEDLSKINLESYINDLIKEILSSLSSNENVTTNINSSYNSIGLKTIVPLGLMINELLSNSFKHAFSEKLSGIINIEIHATKTNEFILKYSDNGIWKTPIKDRVQFGLELIETLTEQLEGTFTREESAFVFQLKNLDI